MSELTPIGRQLADGLTSLQQQVLTREQALANEPKINIVGAGGVVTAAYEHLRNAAENTEEHLLLQRAIKRFFTQLFVTRDEKLLAASGDELAVELTLAGYIANDSLTRSQLDAISTQAVAYYRLHEQLTGERNYSSSTITHWTLDVLAANIESLLNDHGNDYLFADIACHALIDVTNAHDDEATVQLLIAVYRTLLHFDTVAIRALLLRRYGAMPQERTEYITLNQHLDDLFESSELDKMSRIVDRQGAPLRILQRMIDNSSDMPTLLTKREAFLEAYEQQVNAEYQRISQRLDRAIVRSVAFLVITKFLIGIAIEVPYDYWVHGQIIWHVLLINLFFPPLYMVALRLTLSLPTYANTTALVSRIDGLLYGGQTSVVSKKVASPRYGGVFSAVYSIVALVIFGLVSWGLWTIGFSLVHIAIFFIFVSAASFLGFRLSRMIRELEVIQERQNGMTFIRDLIYLPFVTVGQWMSEKYAQVNIVSMLLDMMIELPLKTVLRMIRQWSTFIDDRKDRI